MPEALRVMVNLKCLKAEHTSSLCTIPKQVISVFKKLQVLRIIAYDISHLALKDSVLYGDSELLVEELFELKQLNALNLTIKSSHAFQKFLSSNNVKSCIQYLGLIFYRDDPQPFIYGRYEESRKILYLYMSFIGIHGDQLCIQNQYRNPWFPQHSISCDTMLSCLA